MTLCRRAESVLASSQKLDNFHHVMRTLDPVLGEEGGDLGSGRMINIPMFVPRSTRDIGILA